MPVAAPEAPPAEPANWEEAPARRRLVALTRLRGLRFPRAGRPAPAALIGAGLAATVLYAAFAHGSTGFPAEARVQVTLAALTLASVTVLLVGRGIRVAAPATGWAGLLLLAGFVAWTGVSLGWSVAADLTWVELNRWLAYLLAAALGVVIGSSLPRALERTALAYVAVATAVALYAIAGKAVPGVSLDGVFDLNHTAFFSRLREPLGYWNALSLFCVLAVPLAIRAAADADRRRAGRLAFAVVAVVLGTTVGLTYSRGGFVALAVALGFILALGPGRARLAATTGAVVLGAIPPLVVAFTREDLTGDGVPLAARTGDGLVFLAALAAGAALAAALVWAMARAGDRLSLGARARRGARRALVAAAAAVALLAMAAVAVSKGEVIAGAWDSFKEVKYDKQNDPNRILQTNSGNRWVWWNEAAGAWWDAPVEGHGAGSFPVLHRRYRDDTLEVRQPHSVPLELLSETGLIGALLALGGIGALAAAGWSRIASLRRAERTGVPAGREHRHALAVAAAVTAALVHLWFDWDADIPAVALPLFVFLGVLAARPRGLPAIELPPGGPGLRGFAASPPQRALALGIAALLAAGIAVSAALPSIAAGHLEDARDAAARGDFPGAAREARIAKALNPLAVDPVLVAAAAAQQRNRFAEAAGLYEEAVRRQPDNPQTWLRLAAFEYTRGDYPRMQRAAYRLLTLDPRADVGRYFFLRGDVGRRSATATGTPLPPAP